jgi:hypothetical protein
MTHQEAHDLVLEAAMETWCRELSRDDLKQALDIVCEADRGTDPEKDRPTTSAERAYIKAWMATQGVEQ